MPLPAIFLAAKGVAAAGHLATPHAIAGAHLAAPHIVDALGAAHTHAIETGMSPHVVALTQVLHTKAVHAMNSIAVHAGHTATHTVAKQAIKAAADEVAHGTGPAAVHAVAGPFHAVAQGVHHGAATQSSADLLATVKTGAKLTAPMLGKVAFDKFRETPTGEALVDRVKGTPTAKTVSAGVQSVRLSLRGAQPA